MRVLEARAQLGVATKSSALPSDPTGLWLPAKEQGECERASGPVRKQPGLSGIRGVNFKPSWELDFWGKFRRTIESANAGWMATIADYDTALVSLTADVADAYVLIRTLEKRIRDRPPQRGDSNGEPSDCRGPVSVRYGLAAGCGPGRISAQQHPGFCSGPGSPTATDSECPLRRLGLAAE